MTEATSDRIYNNYQYAGLTVAGFILLLLPLLWSTWPHTLLCVFLQLPAYCGHQVEEYFHDNFRTSVNQKLGKGREVLTRGFVLLVNIPGIWGVDLLALYLAFFVRPGLGLIAIYLSLVNGVVHLVGTLLTRAYNPGLITALLLLLPCGVLGLWAFHATCQASTADHLWGLGVALGIHLMIVLHLLRRRRAVLLAA